MTEHYYTSRPTSAHDRREVTYTLRDGRRLVFATDAGVFSKDRVDRGTIELLKAVDALPGQSVLDLGCGYGPVGIVVAAREPGSSVLMVDVNERACELSRENILRNGVSNAKVLCSDGFEAVGSVMFDVIATNPPIRAGRKVLEELVRGSHQHLIEGGQLCLVVRTRQGAASLKAYVEQVFGNADEPEIGGGYRVIRAVKRGGI